MSWRTDGVGAVQRGSSAEGRHELGRLRQRQRNHAALRNLEGRSAAVDSERELHGSTRLLGVEAERHGRRRRAVRADDTCKQGREQRKR